MGIIFEGLELAKQGNYDESELRYYEVTAIDPNYSAVWYAASFSNYPNGLDELLSKGFTLGTSVYNKIEAYDAVLCVHPRNTRALMWKGFCLDKLGKYDEGLGCYKEAIKINPHALWILTNKVRLDLMFNENDEAIFTLEALLKINQKDHIALGIMGEALSALGRDDEAIIFFDRSLEIQPINAITLCDKGTSLDNIKRVPEAYDCFEEALEIEPNNFCVLTNRGVVLQELGREKESLASYDKALRISPTFANALYNKARLKAAQNKSNDALDLLEEAIRSDQNCKERAKHAPEFRTIRDSEKFIKLTN
jgi:tetratricopeptide (TPR) repeat protein